MDLANRKTWLLIGGTALALFAIYLFASPGGTIRTDPEGAVEDDLELDVNPRRVVRANPAPAVRGIEPIHLEWLEPTSRSFRSDRNLFAYVEPPPPPPVVEKPPPPPPDRDGDGVPDYLDNCPDVFNPDQTDIDRNGIGAACQDGPEIPPPPPPRQPPAFPYQFLGTFGPPPRPIAVFSKEGEVLNVRVGETFGGSFVLTNLGIESADIGYIGFPPDVRKRVPIGK